MKPDAQLKRMEQELEVYLERIRELERKIKAAHKQKDNEGERTIRTRALLLSSYGRAEEGEVMERIKAGIPEARIALEFNISVMRVRKIRRTHEKG